MLFDRSEIDSGIYGSIEAKGRGSEISFFNDRVDNSGLVEAGDHGRISFDDLHVDNSQFGTIEADGWGSKIKFDRDYVDNSGLIEADRGGKVSFYESHIDNALYGLIEANGHGSEVKFDRDQVEIRDRSRRADGGKISFHETQLTNAGVIEATDGGMIYMAGAITNERDGLILAADGGKIDINATGGGGGNAGTIEALDGGIINLVTGGGGGGGGGDSRGAIPARSRLSTAGSTSAVTVSTISEASTPFLAARCRSMTAASPMAT